MRRIDLADDRARLGQVEIAQIGLQRERIEPRAERIGEPDDVIVHVEVEHQVQRRAGADAEGARQVDALPRPDEFQRDVVRDSCAVCVVDLIVVDQRVGQRRIGQGRLVIDQDQADLPIGSNGKRQAGKHLRQVPVGEPGELYIGSVGLARGYLNRPELTAEKFIRHPFSDEPDARLYRTGDLARYLPDGQIAFLGRADHQIKLRGYRIEPEEIISALNKHPAIQASIVIARDDIPDEKRLVAYIVPAADARPTANDLREMLLQGLPDYMIPATFVHLEALPQTPNGKVDRARLPAPDEHNTLHDDLFTAPRTLIEVQLAEIVASLLKVERVSVEDNFFMLGGHSLLGTQLIVNIATTFGVDLALRALFDAPTIRQLSAEIEWRIVAKLTAMNNEEALRSLE